MRVLRFSIAQQNFKVGDIEGNSNKIKKAMVKAEADKTDVLILPELSITGYPPEDLMFKPEFIRANIHSLQDIIKFSEGKEFLLLVGFVDKKDDIYNAVALIDNGELVDVYHKIYLPNYGVFDEKRYFKAGNSIPIYNYYGIKLGVNICEDIWYPEGPGHYQATLGDAEVILNLSASPFHAGKQEYRESMYSTRAGDESVILLNCNMVGGQDELVFDGGSTVYNQHGNLIARLKRFEEDFQTLDINIDGVFRQRLKDIRRRETKEVFYESPFPICDIEINSYENTRLDKIEVAPIVNPLDDRLASIYKALVLGTRDYVNKSGFDEVIIAISGGIDSALVAEIAVAALGSERVQGIYMPTNFSADISGEDAAKLCENLGIELHQIAIQDLFEHYRKELEPAFEGTPFGVAEENIQSRIRGNIVMALSNKFGYMVLTTGNKSEMSTGYATLYGDMAGGFAVIKDVVKTDVFALSRYINCEKEIIPNRIIERPPSAELRPDQKDSDSLPDYDILDAIIRAYVEDDLSTEEIIAIIDDVELVKKTIRMIDRNEYKRRQAPPGIKVTPKAFGRDRRMPIINGFGV